LRKIDYIELLWQADWYIFCQISCYSSEKVTDAFVEPLLLVKFRIDMSFDNGPLLFLRLLEVNLGMSAWKMGLRA